MALKDDFEIEQEIVLPASVDVLWDYLINQDGLKTWLQADSFTIDIIEGGAVSIPFHDGDRYWQVVGETALMLPQEKFAFSWIEQDEYGEEWINVTFVTLALAQNGDSTRLTVTHSGLKNLPATIRDAVYRRYLLYWSDAQKISALKTAVLAFQSGR